MPQPDRHSGGTRIPAAEKIRRRHEKRARFREASENWRPWYHWYAFGAAALILGLSIGEALR